MTYSRAEVIRKYKQTGDMLDVLKAVQAAEGYLSDEALEDVAKAYGRFPSEVYETATFYSMLAVGHKTEHIVEVCGSTCCDVGHSKAIMDAVRKELGIEPGEATPDGKWLFRRCECLGHCDTSPNVMVDEKLLTNATKEQVIEQIRKAGA